MRGNHDFNVTLTLTLSDALLDRVDRVLDCLCPDPDRVVGIGVATGTPTTRDQPPQF